MDAELYYTPPINEIFIEVKEACEKIWRTYDDTCGYATEKVNEIHKLENVGDNMMHMIAKFDHWNQQRLATMLSPRAKSNIRLRMIRGGSNVEFIVF